MALWRQVLGVASLASGGGTLAGSRVEFDGVAASRFGFPDNIDVYLANVENDIVISPSKFSEASERPSQLPDSKKKLSERN